MMLIDRTVSTAAARVRQVSTDRPLEEALTSLARELSVMFPGALVPTDDTLHARLFSAIAAAGRSAAELGGTLVVVVVVVSRRRVVVGGSARPSSGAVHPDGTEV